MEERLATRTSSFSWELNNEGNGKALVIRYCSCNLQCPLCYSQAYSYRNKVKSRKCVSVKYTDLKNSPLPKRFNWVRIQGGEPLLSPNRLTFTKHIINTLLSSIKFNQSKLESNRIIIQTNGLFIARNKETFNEFLKDLIELLTKKYKDLETRIIFELSFKGCNPESAALYSGKKETFELQIEAFKTLYQNFENFVWKETNKIVFYLVAGFGPELNKKPSIIPVFPFNQEKYPLFHRRLWHKDFEKVSNKFLKTLKDHSDIYKDFIRNIKSKEGELKIPMESLECAQMQKGWLSELETINKSGFNTKEYIYILANENNCPILKKYDKYFGKADNKIIKLTRDLKKDFYQVKPKIHYPFL